MLRAPQPRKASLGRRLLDNPFLALAIIAAIAFAVLFFLQPAPESSLFRLLTTIWQTLGIGFHLAANLVARLIPDLPELLDVALVALVGLLPYLLADAIWRRLRR
jgi:drug/metabolite transporter (DMT)-like permease